MADSTRIDLAFLNSHELGDGFVDRMLEIYQNDIPRRYEESVQGFNAGDFELATRAIHTLSSHLRDLGLQDLHQILQQLEAKDLSSYDRNSYLQELKPISEYLDGILTQIKTARSQLSPDRSNT